MGLRHLLHLMVWPVGKRSIRDVDFKASEGALPTPGGRLQRQGAGSESASDSREPDFASARYPDLTVVAINWALRACDCATVYKIIRRNEDTASCSFWSDEIFKSRKHSPLLRHAVGLTARENVSSVER